MKHLPKIHECLGDWYLRPALSYAYLTKKEMAASNAHILVVHQSNELFEPEFLESLPEKGIFLRKEALIDLTRKDIHSVIFHPDMKIIEILHIPSRGPEPFKRYYQVLPAEDADFTYPDYQKIFPTGPMEAVEKIGINVDILKKLNNALGTTNGLRFEFYGEHKSIIVKANSTDYMFGKGLIMPIIINN